jgi:uncharacterized protein YeaO (DUF488 family)
MKKTTSGTSIPISTERVYEYKKRGEGGLVILVDRLWPRGVRKESLPLDHWAKDWAPSPDLRTRFHEGEIDYRQFRLAYRKELAGLREAILGFIRTRHPPSIVLLYGLKDREHNNAQVLKELLDEWMR